MVGQQTSQVKSRTVNIVHIVIAASLVSTIGGLPFNTMPVLLGSAADAFSLDARQIGLLGSSYLAGFLLGNLFAPLWIGRARWRIVALFGIGIAVTGFILSSRISNPMLQYPVWAFIGLGTSIHYSLAIRAIAEIGRQQERLFGIRMAIEITLASLVLFVIPALFIVKWGYTGATLGIAVVIMILALSIAWLPARSKVGATTLPSSNTGSAAAAWCAWVVLFLFFSGQSGLWVFMERIGNGIGVSPSGLGVVFAVLKLIGGAAGATAALIGTKLGFRWPHVCAFLFICTGLLLLKSASGTPTYASGAWCWEFGFTIGVCYSMALITRLDVSHKMAVLVPSALALGGTVGPATAGFLLTGDSFIPVYLFAGICALFGMLANLLLSRKLPPADELLADRSEITEESIVVSSS
jgi:MFS family permease